ncbi:MAG: 2-dehydropantoate 2-reductase [Chloroflexota bacterium]
MTAPAAPATLRLLSFGAGAIGAYIGGSLALAGHPLVFLERAKVASQLHQSGLRLEIAGQVHHLPAPNLVSSIEEALSRGPFDLAIFALKSFDTQPVLDSLKPFRQALPPILCLQNGVDNEPALRAVLGDDQVIAATVTSAIGRRGAGDILLERLRGVGVAVGHPLAPSLVAAMNKAGLNARLYPRPTDMKWSKMLTNLLANATSAILNLSPAEIFAHPGLYRLEVAQLREALAVMRAQKIGVVDLPATPVRLLAFGVRRLPPWLSRPLVGRAAGSGRGGKMPSFHIDLYSGRGKSEVDYLNGAVARHAERLGLPAPANRLLNDVLLQLTRGEIPLQDFAQQPEKLLERFAALQAQAS